MSDIRVVRDSCGGQHCLLIYRDGRAIMTIWEGEDIQRRVGDAGIPELDALLETMKLLGLTFDQVACAAEVFFNERNKEN